MQTPDLSFKANRKFYGKTKAYLQFIDHVWRIRTLIDLGAAGIDKELQERIEPLFVKFSKVKGVRGRTPADYKPDFKLTKSSNDDFELEMDARSAHIVKKAIAKHKKRHHELKSFHYSNLTVSLWASFETYNITIFEELYRKRPDLLKSSEQISIKDAIEHQDSILDHLIERQLEALGHFKIKDTIDYYKKRIGIDLPVARAAKLEKYYFLRNVMAHKTGLLRPTQKLKSKKDFHVVGNEIRVSRTFILNMAEFLEKTVEIIEKRVIDKFY